MDGFGGRERKKDVGGGGEEHAAAPRRRRFRSSTLIKPKPPAPSITVPRAPGKGHMGRLLRALAHLAALALEAAHALLPPLCFWVFWGCVEGGERERREVECDPSSSRTRRGFGSSPRFVEASRGPITRLLPRAPTAAEVERQRERERERQGAESGRPKKESPLVAPASLPPICHERSSSPHTPSVSRRRSRPSVPRRRGSATRRALRGEGGG